MQKVTVHKEMKRASIHNISQHWRETDQEERHLLTNQTDPEPDMLLWT